MGYDLHANNKELKPFHFGGWIHLLEQCGAYFTCMFHGARWYALWDGRMDTHRHDVDDDGVREDVVDHYPAITCNCGSFEVIEEEARVMARIARNYAAIQRTLEEPLDQEKYFSPIDTPEYLRPFPQWIRRDWVEQYEVFAEWAEQSRGFRIH